MSCRPGLGASVSYWLEWPWLLWGWGKIELRLPFGLEVFGKPIGAGVGPWICLRGTGTGWVAHRVPGRSVDSELLAALAPNYSMSI